jgi:hypothetical protein
VTQTIKFEQICVRVAGHQAREAARNSPIAVARRAAFTLHRVLGDLSPADRREILDLLAAQTAELAPVIA